MPILKSDVCWVAGVLDEQSYIIRKKNKSRATPQLVLCVETRHLDVVKELCDLTGVQNEPQDEQSLEVFDRRGCAEHCPPDEKHVHSGREGLRMPRTDRWSVTGAAAGVVLHNCLPHMEEDREFRATYAEILQNTVTHGQGFHKVKEAVVRLRDLGWDLPPSFRRMDLDS